jgi:hypothetical protein
MEEDEPTPQAELKASVSTGSELAPRNLIAAVSVTVSALVQGAREGGEDETDRQPDRSLRGDRP